MLRKAILIGNPNSDPNSPLPGVLKDLRNFKAFLSRKESGAWDSDEIITLVDQDRDSILAKLQNYNCYDYTLVLAAGHGSIRQSQNYDTTLRTGPNRHNFVASSELVTQCARQVIIFDTCRVVEHDLKKSVSMESLTASLNSYTILDSVQRTREDYKKEFNQRLQASPKGVYKFFSCGTNETAGEYDQGDEGGYYTSSLMRVGLKGGTQTILAAHNKASLIVSDIDKSQNPQAHVGRTQEVHTPIFTLKLH